MELPHVQAIAVALGLLAALIALVTAIIQFKRAKLEARQGDVSAIDRPSFRWKRGAFVSLAVVMFCLVGVATAWWKRPATSEVTRFTPAVIGNSTPAVAGNSTPAKPGNSSNSSSPTSSVNSSSAINSFNSSPGVAEPRAPTAPGVSVNSGTSVNPGLSTSPNYIPPSFDAYPTFGFEVALWSDRPTQWTEVGTYQYQYKVTRGRVTAKNFSGQVLKECESTGWTSTGAGNIYLSGCGGPAAVFVTQFGSR